MPYKDWGEMDPAMERSESEVQGAANAVSYTLLWAMAETMGFRDVPGSMIPEDTEGWPYLALTTDGGTAFTVQARWDMDGMRFN